MFLELPFFIAELRCLTGGQENAFPEPFDFFTVIDVAGFHFHLGKVDDRSLFLKLHPLPFVILKCRTNDFTLFSSMLDLYSSEADHRRIHPVF